MATQVCPGSKVFRQTPCRFKGLSLLLSFSSSQIPDSSIAWEKRKRKNSMRKPRQLLEGASYHVTARANRREMILDPRGMKDLFMVTIMKAKDRFNFQISNFTILGNHFHFLIRPGKGESLSAIMQWILSVFAMAYNKALGITGHVWGERFYSKILGDFRDFLYVFSYIDENPVRAGLVDRAEQWEYGGLAHHRGGVNGIVDPPQAQVLRAFPLHACLFLA